MKKLTAILLVFIMAISICACSSQTAIEPESDEAAQPQREPVTNPSTQPESKPESDSSKILVVYYSATGNTKQAAEYIASASGGDLFELQPVEPYSDADLDWTDDNSRVVSEHEDTDARDIELVANTVDNWQDYDTVFIGYPIWWGIAAWPVDGFIEANDFTGKTVIPFCTSSSSGLGESGRLLAEAAYTGDWLEGHRFSSSVTEQQVNSWLDELNLNSVN